MTTNQTEIDRLRTKVAELTTQLDAMEWPTNKEYWFITDLGEVERDPWQKTEADLFRRASGNFFKAQAEVDKKLRLINLENKIVARIAELNEGWTPDWSGEPSYFIQCQVDHINLYVSFDSFSKHMPSRFYIKNSECAQTLIKELKAELTEYLTNI